MYDAFFDYLQQFSTEALSTEEKALIQQTFIPQQLRKKHVMLQAGDHCKHFAFIAKGAMRMYTLDENGVEHIVRLGIKDWWMGDLESFVMGTPSIYHIEAWQHSELLYIDRAGTTELARQIPAFAEMRRQLDERNQMANNRRLTSAISASAAKRYTDFIACYPELSASFPQHIIASYLGINKDTLSRVKRQRF